MNSEGRSIFGGFSVANGFSIDGGKSWIFWIGVGYIEGAIEAAAELAVQLHNNFPIDELGIEKKSTRNTLDPVIL